MYLALLLCMLASSDKAVEVRFTAAAPTIDGVIEDTWQQADSAYDFVQHIPYEKTAPTEKTVVYLLQDKDNLYVAFRCYADKHKPTACLTTDEDYVRISIDPFGSKTTGYYFLVFASELFWEGWVFDDGRTTDDSWEGVWYRGVEIYDDRMEVEMKIPFKSIRYQKGLSEWRVQFFRHIAHNFENDHWTEVTQADGDLISRWGVLKNINPQSTGYYFELFPEAYVRYDKYRGRDDKLKPSLSMNLKWDVTPQTTINATVYPDFAQIESDPFTLNLSRYPVYLNERRPFFVEGRDIFRMSDFGDNGVQFFYPLELFYSRRVGKSLGLTAVPIIGGLKVTNKSEDWNIGVLSAYTAEYTDSTNGIVYDEPDRFFGVLRTKLRLMENSDLGMLFSGQYTDENDYNYAMGIDGVYRSGSHQAILQGAFSDRNGSRDWAMTSGYQGFIGNFFTRVAAEAVQDSFAVADIGFVPWAGRKQLYLFSGPAKVYNEGLLRWFYIAPGVNILKEPGEPNWSKLVGLQINPVFRNNWGMALAISGGRYYEADTNYLRRDFSYNFWGLFRGNNFWLNINYSYGYNYLRDYLAYQSANAFFFGYSIIPPMSIVLSGSLWIEWDPNNTLVAMTPRITPRLDIKFSADKSLTIFNEFVMQTPGTHISETEWLTNRVGLLFSWNFRPKSWLYFAINDFRDRPDTRLEQLYTIAAIKIKYLFYI